MKRITLTLLMLTIGASSLLAKKSVELRDPFFWPFEKESIWNMPLHKDAQYVYAQIPVAGAAGMKADVDHIIRYDKSSVMTDIYEMKGQWRGREELAEPKRVIATHPLPKDFKFYSETSNNCFVIFTDDYNFVQTQPMQYIEEFKCWTSKYYISSMNIFEDGIRGIHGGSGMSAIGGTIRCGELKPGSTIRHAMKVNLYTPKVGYYSLDESDGKVGYRWPATKCDSNADDPTSRNYYGGTNPEIQMGTLLALLPSFDIESLRTEPAKIIARAFRDYGAYVVDNTAWDVYAIEIEHNPTSSIVEEVLADYGISFESKAVVGNRKGVNDATYDWVLDMADIYKNLHAIANNDESNIGGGKTSDHINRRAPMAPDFKKSKK